MTGKHAYILTPKFEYLHMKLKKGYNENGGLGQ